MRTLFLAVFVCAWIAFVSACASGQASSTQQPDMQHMPGMEHTMPGMPADEPVDRLLMQQASGTAVNPASAPMAMAMRQFGAWRAMVHGQAFLVDTQQSGPRGHDKLFGVNWAMASLNRHVGEHGRFTFRTMLSLEPATISKRRYPELFQTGETAYGRPIVDGQHPHDLFMELAVEYARQVGEGSVFNVYAAPVGDPTLGPVAYPHRASARELPQATLSHHLQDSTHIANEVISAGVTHGVWRVEASGFHGREPDEGRWNIDTGGIDSWAGRVVLTPGANWAAQVSLGRLTRPEAREPGDIVRSTASVEYNRAFSNGNWATSLIWGRNHLTENAQNLNSYLLESVYSRSRNHLSGRIELADRDDLFADPAVAGPPPPPEGAVFRIAAYTAGYTRDVPAIPSWRTGLGASLTLYGFRRELHPYYGHHPVGAYLFLRIRPE